MLHQYVHGNVAIPTQSVKATTWRDETPPFLTARGTEQQLQYIFRVSWFTAVENTSSSHCLFKQGMPDTRHWHGKEMQKHMSLFLGQGLSQSHSRYDLSQRSTQSCPAHKDGQNSDRHPPPMPGR